MTGMPGEVMYEFTYNGFPTWYATEYIHWFEKPWQEVRETRHERFWNVYTGLEK